jgi:hypothetical protein
MYAKDIKKRGKQKMENEPEQKKRKGETDRTAQFGPTSPAHLQPATRTVISFFVSLTCGTPMSSPSPAVSFPGD